MSSTILAPASTTRADADASAPIVTTSTELLRNYKQVSVMAPDENFAAVQTVSGNALLFSIGTDSAFYVTAESPGNAAGWQRTNLSASLNTQAKTFAVAENAASATIDLALVTTDGQNDVLWLSLGNSSSDTSWLANVAWTQVPFDDPAHPLARVVVADVFINNTSNGESIVVDVLRDPSSTVPFVFRYYIDPTKRISGDAWNPHDVAGDLDASTIVSCLGRRPGDYVDGMYTGGAIAGRAQLFFAPLYNAFNPKVPASPARLNLPGGAVAGALVAVDTGAATTDLFVASGQTIYYFAAASQGDGATGIALLTDPLYDGIRKLFGYGDANTVILWGLNRANQIFYVRCPRSQLLNASAWSTPLPIVLGAEQVSPYVNRANNGNTFFVQSGPNDVQRATQAPDTTTWRYEHILLPAPTNTTAMRASSYTTRIQVTDSTKKPLANVMVAISAQHRVGVYLNNLYTILDTEPVSIATDGTGAITIVEWVETVRGTPITATLAGAAPASVNPMTKAFAKAASLNSADALRGAQITAPNGTTRPLVSADVSDDDLKVAADAFGQLQSIYTTLPADGSVSDRTSSLRSFQAGRVVSFAVSPGRPLRTEALTSFDNSVETAAGDLLSWLEDATDYVVHLVEDTATDLWHFVASIGGKIYSFVLDAAAKVVGALEAIYRAIKTAIEDLIAFLEFLFEFQSFLRTRNVAKRLLKIALGRMLDEVGTIKGDFDSAIQDARNGVNDWAGLASSGWQDRVPGSDQGIGALRSGADIGEILTAPAMWFFNHVLDNLGGSNINPSRNDNAGPLQAALDAINNPADAIMQAIHELKSQLIDGSVFDSASLGDILKKIAAIVVDAFLDGAQTVIDVLLDALALIAREAVALLDTPIWIPVISDILSDFGITLDFSLLDVFMLIAAIPATIVYKLATGSAPFEGDFGDKILAANSFADLQAAFGGRRAFVAEAAADSHESWAIITLTSTEALTVYRVGHAIAGVGALTLAVLIPAAVVASSDVTYGYFRTAANAVTATSNAMATLFESPLPIVNADMYRMGKMTSSLAVLNQACYGGWRLAAQNPTPESIQQASTVCTGLDAVLAFLSMTPTCYHFQELAGDPAGSTRSSAIVNETSNLINDLDRIVLFFVAVNDDPPAKIALAAVSAALMFGFSGLQIAEATINPF